MLPAYCRGHTTRAYRHGRNCHTSTQDPNFLPPSHTKYQVSDPLRAPNQHPQNTQEGNRGSENYPGNRPHDSDLPRGKITAAKAHLQQMEANFGQQSCYNTRNHCKQPGGRVQFREKGKTVRYKEKQSSGLSSGQVTPDPGLSGPAGMQLPATKSKQITKLAFQISLFGSRFPISLSSIQEFENSFAAAADSVLDQRSGAKLTPWLQLHLKIVLLQGILDLKQAQDCVDSGVMRQIEALFEKSYNQVCQVRRP